MNWTKEQTAAIDARGGNILLAAAAGSGKTAVLVQRIIKLITDKNKPVDVNRLLVLTFTNAAASEMRNKISAALEKEIEEQPKNEHLRRQRLLMGSANISTVHSFCREMLKANIHLTDIPVDFTLCSQNDSKIILASCINEVLEKYYTVVDRHTAFRELASGYGGKKNDEELRGYIENLYNFVMSMPDPVEWLNNSVKEYKKVYTSHSIRGTVWDKTLKKSIRRAMEDAKEIMEAELSYCEEYLDNFDSGEPHEYTVFFTEENGRIQSELKKVEKLLEIEEENRYDKISEIFDGITFKTLVRLKKASKSPELIPFNERVKQYRNAVKAEISNMKSIVGMPESTMVERICLNYPRIKTLKNIIIRVMRKFKAEKREKGFLDFNDLEHEMLNLVRNKDGSFSETAYSLKELYEEILVDEYQDTNYIQDTIFRTISRNNKNIFMVGDIKQSIYMFRNAVPELFLEKYESYRTDKSSLQNDGFGNGRRICLNKNFRSRREVIDTVNFIFENLMTAKLGGVDYKDDEKLDFGANYPKISGNDADSEIIFIREDEENSEEIYAIEARAAALKVKELVAGSFVTDKESGELRRTEYRDITVLVRDANKLAAFYEEAFLAEGVPIYTGVQRSFLESVEVQTVISFLQTINNPYQDVPLIAVMRSPVFAFSADELAEIRSYKRRGYFYDALLESAKDEELGFLAKIQDFLKELNFMRTNFEFADIHSIIWHIYYNYNYFSLAGVMDNGDSRQENLNLLYNMALDFENSMLEGLFGFMSYIDDIYENKCNITITEEKDPNSNIVTFMSIHQSKGLEFPVVIIGGVSKKMNFGDAMSKLIWNRELGISAKCYDEEINALYPTITTNILTENMKRNTLSEEMRLLYVALTRAKEKLVIITSEKRQGKWNNVLFDRNGKLLNCCIAKAVCMQNWILAALCRHKNAEILREAASIVEDVQDSKLNFDLTVSECFTSDILSGQLCSHRSDDDRNEIEDADGHSEINDKDFEEISDAEREEIKENLFRKYKYKVLGEISAKLSVTELKRMKNEADKSADDIQFDGVELNLFDDNRLTDVKGLKSDKNIHSISEGLDKLDDFTFKSTNEISRADIGTIVHFVMQHIDFEKAYTKEEAEIQIEKMVEYGMIDKKQADMVDADMIANFANDEICKRMLNSKNVKKEFKFYITMPVPDIYDVADDEIFDGESVMVQGIVDCFFEEDDGIVIVDYKTDRVKDEYLKKHSEKYRTQLEYYQKAIEKIFDGKKVKEKYLYYLTLGKSIEIR